MGCLGRFGSLLQARVVTDVNFRSMAGFLVFVIKHNRAHTARLTCVPKLDSCSGKIAFAWSGSLERQMGMPNVVV